uniref:NADH dehydrogenase subunit 2 n=1 Tax=Gyrodactylus gurleyi TaxID=83195 RepID=A0A1C7A7J1_9PLAT|nr:NADH dehydrogenase subunit 2 [Gyrodactylus gurleyi]AMZ79743.1 NADH dehydrogenase subunit 2 [Gyrodactylus gurleyi]
MILNLFSVLSVSLISLCLFISLTCSNILILWVLIEISGFCLIYIFLLCDDNSNVSFSSFIFYLINGISSILIVSGVYFNSTLLVEFGIFSKFFIFPFSMALFYIFNNVNWTIIYIIGFMFKVFIICLSFIVTSLSNWSLLTLTLILCGYFLCFVNLNIKGMWFVINLSSGVLLFSGCICLDNSLIYLLLLAYLSLSLINVYLFSQIDAIFNSYIIFSSNITLSYLFFIVGFPVSLNIIYKILGIIILLNLNYIPFVLLWGSYVIIETGFLFFYFSNLISNIKSLY